MEDGGYLEPVGLPATLKETDMARIAIKIKRERRALHHKRMSSEVADRVAERALRRQEGAARESLEL